MSKKDMTAVIDRCLKGDSFAQEELVLAVQDRVYYHCRKMLKDEDRAFDLTQDVLMTMLTKLDTLKDPEAFWSWLGGITANLCRNAINRGPREVQIPEDEEGNSLLDTYETLDEQVIPDKALDNDETRRMIAELVDDLPDVQRQCVLLYYYDEMSVKDIASSLAVSENTVKSRLNYARKSIKEGVDRYEKQGVKLYSASPLALLLFFLGRDAQVCGMTAEQAAELTQRVIQGASAAAVGTGTATGIAGGKAATGTAATAKAAAGKTVLGLSTKAVAGIAAGAVVVGGVAGGVLLGNNEDKYAPPSMDYIDPPAWIEYAFDEVEDFMFPGCEAVIISEHVDDYGEPIRRCMYDMPVENLFHFSTYADMESSQINLALLNTLSKADADDRMPMHWRDISLGDSFETVLEKLGIEEFDPEEVFPEEPTPEMLSNLSVHCTLVPNAPEKSHYSCGYSTDTSQNEKAIFIDYCEYADSYYEVRHIHSISFWFEEDRLVSVSYMREEAGNQEKSPYSAEAEPDEAPVDETEEIPPQTEIENISSVDDLIKDDILVEFDGEKVEASNPFRMYSYMFTRTEESYYAISPNAAFTVTNNGKNENAYLEINISEYIRSEESEIIVVNHDGEIKEIDKLGEYWNDDMYLWLTDQPTEISAGENLYWAKHHWGGVYEEGAEDLHFEKPDVLRLYPGESVTFHLPEREQDTICAVLIKYNDGTEDHRLPGTGYWVSADDVTSPSSINVS